MLGKLGDRNVMRFASRIRNATRDHVMVALGAIALELVILFSFSSHDGLFLIIPALAVGTFVFILDGKMNTGTNWSGKRNSG